ncbi:unnamed protein product [Auanema sp. JU1783]|nr:unnamed protein product [Auanema sp. JU1783]
MDRFDCVCLLCNGVVRSACSTNLSRHMKRHHPETALLMSRTREALLLSDTSSDTDENIKVGDGAERKRKRMTEDRVGLRGRRQYMGGSDSQSLSDALTVSARLSTEGKDLSLRLDHYPPYHHDFERPNKTANKPLLVLDSTGSTKTLEDVTDEETSFSSDTFCLREDVAASVATDVTRFLRSTQTMSSSGAVGYLSSAASASIQLPPGAASSTSSPSALPLIYQSGNPFMNDSSISPSSASTTTSSSSASSGVLNHVPSQIPNSGAVLSCPVPLHPYTLAPVQPPVVTSTLTLDLPSPWCFPTYPDIRHIEQVPYDHDIPYTNIGTEPKIDQMKYDFADLRAKQFEETRLYHKQQEIVNLSVKENKLFDDKEEQPDRVPSNSSDVTPPAKRGRPTENPCWSYFIRLDDQNVRCRLCTKVVKSACATNMTKHLERHHHQDYQHLVVQIKQYRTQKGPNVHHNTSDQGLGPNILNQNNPVKSEIFNDGYGNSFDSSEHVFRNFGDYEPNDPHAWQRPSWSSVNQWQTHPHDMASASADSDGQMARTHSLSLPNKPHQVADWAQVPTPASGNSRTGEKAYLKRNRKTEHPVWEYFKRTADGNAQCTICAGIVKSPCSSNFMRHLMRHHSTEYNNVYVKWVEKRGPNKF